MGKHGAWAEMAKAKREQGDEAAAQQMRARRDGTCDNCGATVGPCDLIRWDRGAKKIAQCRDCGLTICGRLMLAERGRAVDTSANDLRRSRAGEIARAELAIERWESKLPSLRGEELAKAERRIERAKSQRADVLKDIENGRAPLRREPAWSRPTARDIEIAKAAARAAQERADREEAEERAAQVAESLSPAARTALRFYALAGEFRAIGAAEPADLEAGTRELVAARLVRPWCQSYEPTAEGDAVVAAA